MRDRQVTPGLLLIAQLALPTMGFYLLQLQHGEVRHGWLVLATPLILAIGMVLGPRWKLGTDSPGRKRGISQFLFHAFWVLTFLAALHFSIGGIPLLSASVETDRFNLGGSGLGGFPSRAVLYAIPALALFSLATVDATTKRQTVSIWTLYILTQLGLGFKGALFEIIVMAAIGYLIRVVKPKLKHVGLLLLGLCGALLYVEVVRSLYGTTAAEGTSGIEYIAERSTTQAIESGYLALWYSPEFSGGLSAFWSDLQQLLQRYVGAAHEGNYTFDMLMSSIVTGTPLGVGMFVVPVTVGGAVYLLFSLATPLVIVVLGAIGWGWSWAVTTLRRSPSVFRGTLAAMLILGLRAFVLNGNGAYLLINLTFAVLILWICALPSWYTTRIQSVTGFPAVNVRLSESGRSAI